MVEMKPNHSQRFDALLGKDNRPFSHGKKPLKCNTDAISGKHDLVEVKNKALIESLVHYSTNTQNQGFDPSSQTLNKFVDI